MCLQRCFCFAYKDVLNSLSLGMSECSQHVGLDYNPSSTRHSRVAQECRSHTCIGPFGGPTQLPPINAYQMVEQYQRFTCWVIWKCCYKCCIKLTFVFLHKSTAKLWHHIKVYYRIERKKLYSKVNNYGRLSIDDARWLFVKDFGSDSILYRFTEIGILLAPPPRF